MSKRDRHLQTGVRRRRREEGPKTSPRNANVYLRERNIQMHISHSEEGSLDQAERVIEHQRGGRHQHLSASVAEGR